MVERSPDATPATGTLTPSRPVPGRWSTWLWPALLTAVLGAIALDRAPLWRDELATWSAASRPLRELFRLATQVDGVTTPYYLLMHGWIRLVGDSPTALRLPALLAMTGAAALTARLGTRLFDARTGLLAGLLFAVVPATSRYGQEARGYALATLLLLAATLLLMRALAGPTPARWAGYALAVTGLALTHLVALIALSGHAVAVMAARRRHRGSALLRRWALTLTPVVALLTPLALLGRRQQARQLSWVTTPTLGDLCTLPGAVLQAAAVGGLLVGLAVVGAGQRDRVGLLLGCAILLPVVLLFLGGLVTRIWVPRYLVVLVPFGCLLAARALTSLRLTAALPVVAVVLLLGAPEQANLRRTHEWPRSKPVDYRQAAEIIARHRQPADSIVYSPRDRWAYLETGAAYYLGDALPRDVLRAEDAVSRGEFWSTECADPAGCLTGADRVWLLVRGERSDPYQGMPARKRAALHDRFVVTRTWTPPGLTVALLTSRS